MNDREIRALRRKAIQQGGHRRANDWHWPTILDHAHQRRLTMKLRGEQTKRFLLRSVWLVIGLGIIVASAAGQEFRGSISGRVTDPAGAAVPGSQVTVTNTATNVPNSVTANEEGVYTVLYLAPGRYTVVVEKQGFKKLLQ